MDWYQVLTILGGNMALFMWATRQARTDFLYLDRKLEDNRKETHQMSKETQQIVISIQEEIKDFHAKIIAIEDRRR